MSAAKPCQQQLQAAIVCLQFSNPGECGCFDPDTFPVTFEEDTRTSYLSAQAFISPSSSEFCDISNQRVCDFYQANQSCCCQSETEIYRRCLFETILPLELPRPISFETSECQNICGSGDETMEGGSKVGIMAGVIAAVALVGSLGAYLYCRRRRATTSIPVELRVGGKFEAKQSDDGTHPQDITGDMSTGELSSAGEVDVERGAPTQPPAPVVPSRSLLQEAEEEMVELDLKAEKLRSKREAIENWHKDRKNGSNRSLDSYKSDEENMDEEEKQRRRAERRAKREAARAAIRAAEKELALTGPSTNEGPSPDRPVRRSSNRSLERADNRIERSSSSNKLERKSSRSKLSDEDDGADRSTGYRKERRSSRSRLDDH